MRGIISDRRNRKKSHDFMAMGRSGRACLPGCRTKKTTPEMVYPEQIWLNTSRQGIAHG
jgi:hypothetical protein